MGYEMNRKFTAAVIVSGFFLLASGFPLSMEAVQDIKEEGRPLLRIDLLMSLEKEMKPPKRNIFSPEKSTAMSGTSGSNPLENAATGEAISGGEPPSEMEKTPDLFINMKYIGYVRTPLKIVGLIMYEGMAMAVYSGEMIAEGLQIGEITADNIEIIGPNSHRQKVPLEGDQK